MRQELPSESLARKTGKATTIGVERATFMELKESPGVE
jgi:hypothetical protein